MSRQTPASRRFDVQRFQDIADRANMTLDELMLFLESESGRRLRRIVATGMIVSVPLVMRIPGLGRSPLGRAIEFVGGAALVVKLAEAIRDWERSEASRAKRRRGTVIDVPPAGT
jgi:hypothetical protein